MNIVDKMYRAFMKRVHATQYFRNRTARHKKKLKSGRRMERQGNAIIKIRSLLWLKRNYTDNHCRARLYKRLFRGICGALTWKDLDRLFPRPKAARIPKGKKAAAKTNIPSMPEKKGFFARLASAFKPRQRLAMGS